MKRLRKLEGIVEELSGQIEVETVRHTSSAGNSPEAIGSHEGEQQVSRGKHGGGDSTSSRGGSIRSQGSPLIVNAAGRANAQGQPASPGYNSSSHSSPGAPNRSPPDVHKKFGRLVLNEQGVARYVSSALWSRINDEVGKLWSSMYTGPFVSKLTRYSWTKSGKRPIASRRKIPTSRTLRAPRRPWSSNAIALAIKLSFLDTVRQMSTSDHYTRCRHKYHLYGPSTRKTSTQFSRSSMCPP